MTTAEEARVIQRAVRLMEHEARIRQRARKWEVMPDNPYAAAVARDLFTKAGGYRKVRLALLARVGV